MGVMSYGYWNGIKVKLLNLYSGVSAGHMGIGMVSKLSYSTYIQESLPVF